MKKILYKVSIVTPLAVIYVLLMEPVTISIAGLGIYWGGGTTLFYFITFTVVWMCCSPSRKSCCNGSWTELLFYILPVEVLSMIVFAQWHLIYSVVIFFLWLSMVLSLMLYLRTDEKKYRYSTKRHRMYQAAFRRGSVLGTSLLCAIPCFMAVFVYEFQSPVYRAEEETRNRLFEKKEEPAKEEENPDLYQTNIDLLRCFETERWEKFNIDEKITIMQELVDLESEHLGIPPISVTAEMLGGYTLGQYSDETNEMWINIEYLANASVDECIQTICHETFHSYQQYLVDSMDWENAALQSAYFEELRMWKDNQEHYINAWTDGFDAYESQPLETAARSYAEQETERILSYVR